MLDYFDTKAGVKVDIMLDFKSGHKGIYIYIHTKCIYNVPSRLSPY